MHRASIRHPERIQVWHSTVKTWVAKILERKRNRVISEKNTEDRLESYTTPPQNSLGHRHTGRPYTPNSPWSRDCHSYSPEVCSRFAFGQRMPWRIGPRPWCRYPPSFLSIDCCPYHRVQRQWHVYFCCECKETVCLEANGVIGVLRLNRFQFQVNKHEKGQQHRNTNFPPPKLETHKIMQLLGMSE